MNGKCPNCNAETNGNGHFAPPSLGESGFWLCDALNKVQTPRVLSKWDQRFMALATMVSTWSKDPSTQTGAVLVSPCRTDVIVGYNGFPRRLRDDPELYANREVKYSRIVHCEMNAILLAKRSVVGYTLFTWPCLSCDRCSPHVIQAGIARVVGPKPTADMASRWESALAKTRSYYQEACIEVVEYDPVTGAF